MDSKVAVNRLDSVPPSLPFERFLEKERRERHGRRVEVLDGDEVRKGLSRDLGLSK
ncbi:MAG: adenylyl-sulfate kinase [Nitrososphaerota archaeon]|nr:adenylyl-sulfate kinase [Nitrososphaerota archaeon]MDG7020214.1 adenylyl-sulfate kinase [Nitrososphaerota archaeon]MDG7028362.1 adenylyl-sulfate kinase [Nitrososphaerota archaeon]